MKRYSQNNEDEIIINYFNTHSVSNKTLLDIGAFDGEIFSNTKALMETDTQWKGVFVEPSSFCFSKLLAVYEKEPRRVKMINAAVVLENMLGKNTLLEFYDYPNSTVSSLQENHTQKYGYEEKNEFGDIIKPYRIHVGQIGLKEIVNTFGPFSFINLDVEGQSADLVLQDWFDPRLCDCKLLCVEHDNKYKDIANKLAKYDYQVISLNAENIILCHE